MAFCTKCGAVCELGMNVCTGCGNHISDSAGEVKPAALLIELAFGCRTCGALLAEGQSFCAKCGRSLKTAASPQPTPFQERSSTPVEMQATPKNADVVAATPVVSPPPKLVETQSPPPGTEDAVSAVPALTNSEGTTKLILSGIIVAVAIAATGAYFLLYGSGQSAHIVAALSPVASKPATSDTPPFERGPQALHAPVANAGANPDLASVAPSPTQPIPAPLLVVAQSAITAPSGVKPSSWRTAPSVKVTKKATIKASPRQVAASVVVSEVPAPVASHPTKLRCGDVVAKGAGFLNQTCERVGVEAFTTCTNEGGMVFDNCKQIGTTTCGELAGYACSQSQF